MIEKAMRFRPHFGRFVNGVLTEADEVRRGERRARYDVESLLSFPPGVLFDQVEFTAWGDPAELDAHEALKDDEAPDPDLVDGWSDHEITLRFLGNTTAIVETSPDRVSVTNEYDRHDSTSDEPRDPRIDLRLAKGVLRVVKFQVETFNLIPHVPAQTVPGI